MKFLMFSSLSNKTGVYLMGEYIAKALRKAKQDVYYVKAFKRPPYESYYLISFPYYLMHSLTHKCDFSIALKPFPNACLPVLLKKLNGSKTIVDVDDLDYGYTPKLSRIIKIIQESLIKRFDLVTTHNENLYNKLKNELKIPEKKLYKREQGVDLEIFDPKRYRVSNFKKILGIKKEKILIYTGYLSASSSLEQIFEMFKLLLEKRKGIKLLIVGSGTRHKRYIELTNKLGIRNNVIFTGYTSPATKTAEYLSIADACVVYYPPIEANKYRVSIKLREYLAMGKPSICNDFGDLKNFKKYTYNFKTNDMDAFVKQTIKALYQPDKREKKGQTFIRNNLSWDKIIKDLLNRIKDVK